MAKLYKNWTVQEKLCAMLLAQGHTELVSRSGKYRTFALREQGGWLFVGKMGSVRINRLKPTHTGSLDKAATYKRRLADYEDANGLSLTPAVVTSPSRDT